MGLQSIPGNYDILGSRRYLGVDEKVGYYVRLPNAVELTLNVEAKDIRNDLSLQQLRAQVC